MHNLDLLVPCTCCFYMEGGSEVMLSLRRLCSEVCSRDKSVITDVSSRSVASVSAPSYHALLRSICLLSDH